MRPGRGVAIAALVAALTAAAAAAVRPLDANDLFWHLATGREILRTGTVPRTDPFSFASGGGPWIDHEWLWQVAAQSIHALFGQRPAEPPSTAANAALIAAGGAIALLAFALGLVDARRRGVPAAALALGGFVIAEAARERLMVRPETASLLFLALTATLLARRPPGAARALALGAVAAVWANVHPAALVAPVVVLLWTMGDRLAARLGRAGASTGAEPVSAAAAADRSGREGRAFWLALEPAIVAAATFVNPYGWRIWTVPFELRALVRTSSFYNPEWLPPPIGRFPVFYACALLVLAGALAAIARRRAPEGAVLVALLFAAIASRQMRHMGLFSIAALFALGPIVRSLDPGGALVRPLGKAVPAALASAAVVLAAVSRIAVSVPNWSERALEPGRFPVAACEEIARRAPSLRLYNDVRFGGYLVWRFFPPLQVFIDGRNEVYKELLPRLGSIHTGEAPYEDWRGLVREMQIEGAIVRYNESKKGVLYPASVPGAPPQRGYRAWSAFLFPVPEWALVWFDDTALVFMKRGGRGEAWIESGEYRVLNPEDEEYVLERAARDPVFAGALRRETAGRLAASPPCKRVAELAVRIGGIPFDERTATPDSGLPR